MLAICSDLDETPDRHTYWEIMRFLNTTETTAMGPGVGLEVGNTIYFDMPPDQFAYWNTDDAGREMVRALIRSGHIDCLHSFGDLATTRRHAGRALDELGRHGCRLKVWVDHAKAPSNFGPDIMAGRGDVVGSEAYHADLTLQYGIRYVWRGRTTGINGQNVPIGPWALAAMLTLRHPISSTWTMVKQAVKIHLGRRGHPRWRMYGSNQVCRPSTLRDGQRVWEFMRSNTCWRGPGLGATADGFGQVLTPRMLNTLLQREAVSVLYTHLGNAHDPRCPFGESTREAFRLLSGARDDEQVLVTSTHRLLRYLTVRDCLKYGAERVGDTLTIRIDSVEDPVTGNRLPSLEELQGLTFVTPRCHHVALCARGDAGAQVPCKVVHMGDQTHAIVPWRPLVFPAL